MNIQISDNANRVYLYLSPQIDKHGKAYPSVKTIANRVNITIPEAADAVDELVIRGVLTKKVEQVVRHYDGKIAMWMVYRKPLANAPTCGSV